MVSCALCTRCNTTVRVRFSLKMKYIASDLFYDEGERLSLCTSVQCNCALEFSPKIKSIASDLFYVEGERLSLKVIMFSGCDGESKKVISDEYQIILQEQLFGAL